jgi:cytochrome c-type biogenesis protein CcmH/NrfG
VDRSRARRPLTTLLDSASYAAIISDVWTSYSARHAAQLIGLPESAVRSCIRDGLVGTPGTVPAQLSFRDLSALRTVKALVDAGLPLPRVRRELTALQQRLPAGTSLAELTVEARNGEVHVRGTQAPSPAAGTGQLALPFEATLGSVEPRSAAVGLGALHELPRPADAPLPVAVPPATADQWMSRAQVLEERDPIAAIDAYRRSLRLRPDCTEAWINLGRLFAESNDGDAARDCFKSALELDPAEATAYYNLGVLAQDAGKESEAIELYRRALELDPLLAEAHYNLATLFDQSGDSRSAIRHINEYRKLTR